MSAFFPINPGGGAGGGQPQQGNAFVNATINGNDLALIRGDGSSVRVDLSKIIPDITDDLIKNITLNGNNLTLEYASGTTHDVDLKPILNAANVDYDNTTSGLQSTTTQDAIDEINNKLNDAYVSSDYTETTGEFDLIKVDGTKDTYRLAGLDRYNLFLGHNTFNELILLGKTPFVSTGGSKQTSAHRVDRYCGDRRVSTHSDGSPNPKYISAIKIEILPSVDVGETVSGVYVAEITKGNSRLVDIIGDVIVNNGSYLVEQDELGAKVIYVPIRKEYQVDTYFLIGKQGDRNLRESWDAYSPKEEFVNDFPITNFPQAGTQLNWTTGNGWVVTHGLVTDDINVREELSKIGNCDIVSSQIVGKELILIKQDGNRFSIDLTPVLKANNVSFDNATSGLQATTVQGAIDEIDGKVNNAYIDANFDDVSGDLTLIKPNGQNSVLSLSSLLFDVTFDDTNNTLNKVQNGVTTPVIDHVVTEWDDLEFVSKTKGDIRNIFNKHTQIQKDRYYTPVSGGGYEIHSNTSWDLAYIPVVPGQQITVIKNTHDSQNFGVYNEQRRHQQHIVVSGQLVNGMRVYRMTINPTLPQGDTYHLLINMHKAGNNPVDPNKVMVFNGDIANDDLPKEYIPYATHGSIFIDGSEVVHTFNPQGSTLVSQNTQDAIIELDRKITINSESAVKTVNNQRPDAQGNVQVEIGHITGLQNALDGKVNITQLSPIAQPNKVPVLGQNGKLDTAMIPDLSINQVHSVANKQEALNLIANGTASIGHVFILRDDNNSVHMYVNQAGADFNDKCVQLTMSNGSIVSVNQITGDSNGNVTLTANQIRLEAKPTVTVEEELGKKVSTINSVAPNAQGNIDLELGVASDKLQLKVNNTEKSTLNLYTDAEANGLIAYFI